MRTLAPRWAAALLAVVMAGGLCNTARAEPLNLLFLTKSSGFEHSTIRFWTGNESHTGNVMAKIAEKMGATVTVTKDAGLINAESLLDYDVVLFYTSGDLTELGTDKRPVMPADGVAQLRAWIEAGGGYVGFHSASDTLRSGKEGEPTPYTKLVGGEFRTHGRQFKGAVLKVSEAHPAVASIEGRWRIKDEWYLFSNLDAENDMHVLAVLDPGLERKRQEDYNIPNYPIIWCRDLGKGRLLYNAMGHREDVWMDETFQALVADHIRWAAGEGETMATPNREAVAAQAAGAMPKTTQNDNAPAR